MLSPPKRKFAQALANGLGKIEAAKIAGYSEKSIASKAAQLVKDKDVIAHVERIKNSIANNSDFINNKYQDPKEFLIDFMNNETEEPKLRLQAAIALMPYFYPKLLPTSKKFDREQRAKEIAQAMRNRFTPNEPPKH